MTARVDAAIVGGGPAGAIVARGLAQRGWQVLLIERGARLRRKTCGHCLALRGVRALANLGLLERARSLATGRSHQIIVRETGGEVLRSPLMRDGGDAGLIIPRHAFDQMLRDAAADAGAEIMHQAAARVVRLNDGGAELRVRQGPLEHSIECRLLVGADGVGSSIARVAGLADAASAGRKYGFDLDVAIAAARASEFERGAINMFLMPAGYLGVVRQDDDALHVAGLVASKGGGRTPAPREFIQRAAALHPALGGLMRIPEFAARSPSAIGPMPWRPHSICSGSVALVGDAAGYVEPFTGEGITWALHGATALLDSIDRSGGAWNAGAGDIYATMWRDLILRRQRTCRVLSAALERPRVTRWMLKAGRALPPLTRRLVREVVSA